MRPHRRSVLLVAGREITERMRSKAFAISAAVIVAVVTAAVVIPGLQDRTPQLRAGIVGPAPAALATALRDAAHATGARLELRRHPTLAAGEAALRDGRTGVLIVDGRRLVWKSEPDPKLAAVVTMALVAPVPLPARSLEAPDRDREARETIAMVSYLVLLMMVLWYGTAVADGVAQEKGGRVMELLVCRVRPRDLLAGKVLGIGLVGLAQMLLALAAAGVAIALLDTVDVPAAVPATLAAAVLWFALGCLFWSVAYAAVAALVGRVEDLQSAVAPIGWTLVLSALVAPVAAEYPDAWYVHAASLFPTTAPFVMPVRVAVGDVAAWETALAAAVVLAATYWLVRLAGAVYSGAVLRTGPRPRLRDVWTAARAR